MYVALVQHNFPGRMHKKVQENKLGEREIETYFSFCIYFVMVFLRCLVVLEQVNVFLLLLI